jgi:hypothetical protein
VTVSATIDGKVYTDSVVWTLNPVATTSGK